MSPSVICSPAVRLVLATALLLGTSACPASSETEQDATPSAKSSAPSRAEAEEVLPAADAVLAAHVKAVGGLEAISKIHSIFLKSEIQLEARQLRGESRMWWADGKFRVEDEIEGLGSNFAGYDGETLWVQDSFNGLRALEGQEAELYRRGSAPFLISQWRDFFDSSKTLGRRVASEQKLVDVRLTTPLGQEVVMSFDEESGLLAETAFDEQTPDGARRAVTRSSDYREVAGVRLAHRQQTTTSKGTIEQRLSVVEIGEPVDETRFAYPLGSERVPVDPSHQPAPNLD